MDIFRKVDTMSRMSPSKPSRRPRRQFSDEFKEGAVRLVLDEGQSVSAVARELDLTASALRLWSIRPALSRPRARPG